MGQVQVIKIDQQWLNPTALPFRGAALTVSNDSRDAADEVTGLRTSTQQVMPIEFKKNRAIFKDVVCVEEAEGLLEWLQKKPSAKVDLASCSHIHTANLQVLMTARPGISSWPENPELRAWLEPALKPGA